MPKTIGQNLREKFNILRQSEDELRKNIITEINELVSQKLSERNLKSYYGVALPDGPTRVSPWDDQVNETVIAVVKGNAVIDENSNASLVKFEDISTETLVDTYNAIEDEVDNGTFEFENWSELIPQ